MKKTISILALMMLFSTYCLASANDFGDPTEFESLCEEEMIIQAIDCSEWIDAIPEDIDPIHIDPADQLDLRLENMDWTDENFRFNYLLHPCSDEACFRQASLRFRQQTGRRFGEAGCTPSDAYTWIWCCEMSR